MNNNQVDLSQSLPIELNKLTCFDGNNSTTICLKCPPGLIPFLRNLSGSSKTPSFAPLFIRAIELMVVMHELSPDGEPLMLENMSGKGYVYNPSENTLKHKTNCA